MTFRAVLIGLLLGVGVVMFGWYNDRVLQQSAVASGMIPIGVYGLLVVGLMIVNPVLGLIRGAKLQGAEWAVIVALMLVAVVLPGPGLLWHFSQATVLPHHWYASSPGWQKHEVLTYAPSVLLADAGSRGGGDYERVVSRYIQGVGTGDELASPADVPWDAWAGPLCFWVSFITLMGVASLCIVLVIHRQWAHRERVRYPIAEFAAELLAGSPKRKWPDVFYNTRFWLGFVPVFLILGLNGLGPWFDNMITIPLVFDFTAVLQKWPGMTPVPDLTTFTLRPRIYFIVVGFAYFISSEASLSLGISPLLFGVCWYLLYRAGLPPRGHYFVGGIEGWQKFGSYLGIALMILYTGRRYYLSVLSKGVGLARRGDTVERHVVWAARGGVVATVLMMCLLRYAVGLAWPLAILTVLLLLMMFLVITRINVETGLFSIHVWWHPVGVLLGLFGFEVLGPNMLMALGMLSAVMTVEPRVTMIAMGANALKIAEAAGAAPRRIGPWLILAAVLVAVVGITFTLYVQYSFGVPNFGWSGETASKAPVEVLIPELQKYFGDRDGWEHFRWRRWGWSDIHPQFFWSALIGLGLVIASSVLRLRYTWWPLHPILFLVWGIWPLAVMWFSFFLGWLIKAAITRFGGGESYSRNKPLFLGMVAGEFAIGLVYVAWGLGYRLVQGISGPGFNPHP